jgi:transposase
MARRPPHPTYEELLARIAALEAENARLRAELAALRGEDVLPPGDGAPAPVPDVPAPTTRKRPPGWVKATVVVVARHRPRATRAPVPGRCRETPDRIVVHAPTTCPDCGEALRGGRLVGRRQVLDLPPVTVEVIEHQVRERRCRCCGWVGRGAMPELGAEVGAHRRLGWGVAAWVATLRTKLRLPLVQVQWLLDRVWGLHLAVGTVSGLLADVARAGRPTYDGLLDEARASPAVNIDETHWRENGRNGYVWTVSTPRVRFFHYTRSRAGAVAEWLLGEEGTAAVVSDFYPGYDRLDRPQQRCWAHLLRDVADLVADHPADRHLARWAKAVQKLFAKAVAWEAQATANGVRPICRERVADRFAVALVKLCRSQPAGAPQATLCARIERYQTDLFTFVADEAVPPTNNGAERSLRPLVIARKISGGTRSKLGSQTRMILQSLVATWDLRGLDPVAGFLALLGQPAAHSSEIAPV